MWLLAKPSRKKNIVRFDMKPNNEALINGPMQHVECKTEWEVQILVLLNLKSKRLAFIKLQGWHKKFRL